MTSRTRIPALAVAAALAVTLTGCSGFTGKSDTAEPAASSVAAANEGIGPVVGTAVMSITGTGPATVIYSINGGPEQTEQVTLPWEKKYDVVPEAKTTVRAEGGGAGMCTIMLDDKYLVTYEDKPSCSYAHYG